ncbi:unnamed protein product [Clonostachys rhizophaga]|uniref:EF-hand domain-containing protein n=1 Tax=Clonostachys rhizophaga TaxID=160324 RepID=A0A9N9V5I0_9HYPO|nr:unnamed protein product [Clonostachys rhizophaga]
MAYNQPYDPDALPRFAEPEKRGPAAGKSSSPAPDQRYNKPAPLPQQYQQHHQPPPPQQQHQQPPPHRQGTSSSYSQQPSSHPHQQAASPHPHQHPVHSPPPRQPTYNRNSGTPGPSLQTADDNSGQSLLPLFRAVDKDGTGQLSEKELSAALVNGDWSAFDTQTVRMMIRMFDSDRSGTIGFEEFCGLWSFLASWRTLFDRFDIDRSGNISLSEFSDALAAFRYRLSPDFVKLLFRTYDKRQEGAMSFDLFVQSCISLKRMTDVFKKYDDDRDGFITLSFEDFLSEILKQLR